MPLLTMMYSEILRHKPNFTKSRPALPVLKVVERKHLDPHTRALSPSSDSYAEDRLPFLSPGLSLKAVDDDHHQGFDLPLYVELQLPSPDNSPPVDIYINRKASIETVYTPPPLAKPYVDKLLGPNTNTVSRKFGDTVSANLNNSSTFDPFLDDPEGSTRSPPPPYRLPVSELLTPREQSDSNDQDKTVSPPTQPVVDKLPPSTQDSNYSLTSLFLQHGVETSLYFLPPGLLDDDEEDESYVACGNNCLTRHPIIVPRSSSPLNHRHGNTRSPSSTSSNSSQSSSLISHTDYLLLPTVSSASSAYSEDYSLYRRRKPTTPKCCIVKFDSPDTIGVSLEAVLSKKKGCLMDPKDEVMEDWGEKGKPMWIHLIVARNGFKSVFPIQIRCPCGVITRAELAYEIADIMQHYLTEAKTAKSKRDPGRSISGLYLLALRTDNQGLSWRATFADRRRIKTCDVWGKTPQRR